MKIALFTDSFYPIKTGVATHIIVTSKLLNKLGHEILIVAPKYQKGITEKKIKHLFNADSILIPSIAGTILNSDLKLGTPTPRSLYRVKKFNPDIIHFFTPLTIGLEAVLVAKMLNKPLVATFCTYFTEPEGFSLIGLKKEGFASEILSRILWQYAAQFHKSTKAIIAPTQYVANDLKKRWNKKTIAVIPGGIDIEIFKNQSNRNQLRQKYNLTKSPVILWVGRLSFEKNLHTLITAFSQILETCPQTKLVMIGDGPAQKDLEFYCKNLKIHNSVRFLGSIPYEQLTKVNYFSIGDIFISPSTWETQGLSVIEAMATGLPAIAPNVKAMPEIIHDGGLLVKPNDPEAIAKAAISLIKNPTLRKDLSVKAKNQSQKYSLKKNVDKLLLLYKNLLNT